MGVDFFHKFAIVDSIHKSSIPISKFIQIQNSRCARKVYFIRKSK